MRARVTSDTEPFPLRTLAVVWKLTPARAATSFTETLRVGLLGVTRGYYGALSERSPKWRSMGPRPEYPRPNLQRSEWVNLNGQWEFGIGEKPSFDRRILVPFCAESKLS